MGICHWYKLETYQDTSTHQIHPPSSAICQVCYISSAAVTRWNTWSTTHSWPRKSLHFLTWFECGLVVQIMLALFTTVQLLTQYNKDRWLIHHGTNSHSVSAKPSRNGGNSNSTQKCEPSMLPRKINTQLLSNLLYFGIFVLFFLKITGDF